MLTAILCLLVVVLLVGVFWRSKPMTYWKEREVPQTTPAFLFGDLFRTIIKQVSFPEWIIELYQTYPDARYFGLYQFSKPTLLIRDPDLIKQLTVKAFDCFGDHMTFVSEQADPLWANNLFALKGQRWRDMRQTLSPFFTSSKMKHMFVSMSDFAQKYVTFHLEQNLDVVEIELKHLFARYCNDVIGITAFGVETDSLRNPTNDFYLMGKEATSFGGFWKSLRFLMIQLSPKLSQVFKITSFGQDVKNFFYGLVDDTVRIREQKHIFRPDLIHLLMQIRGGVSHDGVEEEFGEIGFASAKDNLKERISRMQISNHDIASQAMIFFFGGFESVSTLMCFIAYELAANPDVQRRLRDEVEETFVECNGKLTYDALLKMKYMDMVVSEALRKWPNVLLMDRECAKPYTIEPAKPGEKPLQMMPGDLIWVPVFAIHHDEKYYRDPDRFDPERFNEENRGTINSLAYIPFGSGPRNCIGQRFAILESKTIIFHILHSFEIIPTKKSQMPLVIGKKAFQLSARGDFWFGFRRIYIR